MTRSIPAALVTALTQDAIQPFHAVEMNFDAGSVRLWTGYGNRTIEGNTYIGVGTLMGIAGIEEASDMSAKGITISLAASDPSIISLALTEPYQGRTARVLFGEFSVTDVVEVFGGLMDVMSTEESAENVMLTLTIESKLVALQRSKVRRYTSANHKARHSGDTFFDFVSSLQDKEILWGRAQG